MLEPLDLIPLLDVVVDGAEELVEVLWIGWVSPTHLAQQRADLLEVGVGVREIAEHHPAKSEAAI